MCVNRSFPSSPVPPPPVPLYQNEVKCSTFYMEIIFHSDANKSHFHKKRLYTWPHFDSEGCWNSEVACCWTCGKECQISGTIHTCDHWKRDVLNCPWLQIFKITRKTILIITKDQITICFNCGCSVISEQQSSLCVCVCVFLCNYYILFFCLCYLLLLFF